MRDLHEINLNAGGRPVTLPPPTREQIALVEDLVAASLPPQYLEFLQFRNGGYPEWDSFISPDSEEGYTWAVNEFFHIAADSPTSTDNEDVVWHYAHRWPGAPRSLLPIADDPGGNLFCLDLSAEGAGRVAVQVHDEPGFPIIPLAASFEAFIDGLFLNPDYI